MAALAERTLRESHWTADTSVPLSDHTVGSLLADRARSNPDTTALFGTPHGGSGLRRYGYAELYDAALQVAAALTALTEPGEFVALWAPNVVEWPIIQYGAALAGRVLVALNPAFRENELVYALENSGATVLIHADENRGYDMGVVAAAATARVAGVRERISLAEDGRWQAGTAGFTAATVNPDDAAMLQFTSGTTGNPKGVLLRHRSLVNVAHMTMVTADVPAGAVCVAPLPTFHTAGCVISTLGPLWVAGTVLLADTFVPDTVLSWAAAERADVLFYVPTVLGALLEAGRGREDSAPRIPAMIGGGAFVPRVLIEGASRVFGAAVHNLFGQTELAPVMTMTRKEDSLTDQLTTIGRPVPQVEVKIAGADGSGVAPLGVPGEICARGYQQMIGYHGDPAATAAAVDAAGWLHTGDVGTMDARGYLTVTGRLKELIISGGENIAPAEVESRLLEHEAVVEAAVVGVPDPKWGETVAAVLVLRVAAGADLVDSVKEQLRQTLAPFKTPRRWYVAESLPVNPAGKVQKFKLRAAILDGAVEELRSAALPGESTIGATDMTVSTPADAREQDCDISGAPVEPGAPRVDYARLIQSERVHGSLYTDPAVFADELERIWYGGWVFVGHESEVPEPNDYVRKNIGPQDVILTRDREGRVHLVANRCAHRGNLVCDQPRGNSSSFRCPYHGWTYSNTGDLLGYPYNKGYGGKGKLNLGLGVVPRVDSYHGFVFGSFNPDVPPLLDHLGAAAGEIDRLARLAPTGKVRLDSGWLRHRTGANWKLLAENETDGYHPQFVHGSIFSVTGSTIGPLYSDASTAVTRALGNGHSENDLRPEFRKFAEPMRWFGTTADRVPEYVAAMRAAHGEAAEQIMIEGAPHVMVFPNLFIAEIQVFNIQPISANECVQFSTSVQLDGADELNRRMLSQSIGSVGPAGMLLADDTEMYERNQVGVAQLLPEWLDVRRGVVRESLDDNGFRIGRATDETAMRAFWQHYKSLMEK